MELDRAFDPRFKIRRPMSRYLFDTVERFKVEWTTHDVCGRVFLTDVGVGGPDPSALQQFPPYNKHPSLAAWKNNLKASAMAILSNPASLRAMVDRHASAQLPAKDGGQDPVRKTALGTLFRAVGNRYLPKDILGSRKNLNQMLKNMTVLLTAGKGCPVMLEHLLHRLDMEAVPWFDPGDRRVRDQMTAKVVVWLASEFFWKLVVGFFRAVETSRSRGEICFVRKSRLQSILDKTLNDLQTTSGGIRPVSSLKKLDKILSLPGAPRLGRCRLLLKKQQGSARVIVRMEKQGFAELLEQKRLRVFLNHLAASFPAAVDVRGLRLHALWKEFARGAAATDSTVYATVADMKDAYGSIKHDQLAAILDQFRNSLPAKLYIHEYVEARGGGPTLHGRRPPSRVKQVVSESRTCLLPRVKGTSEEIDVGSAIASVIRRMRLHTLEFKVGGSRKRFLMTRGLVQGDSLSVPLCNIYYGHLVKAQLSEFLTPSATAGALGSRARSLFARGMDDFIFITEDRALAQRFVERMSMGFPAYGCEVQTKKTQTNFMSRDYGNSNDPNVAVDEVGFCGSILDCQKFICRPDLSVYSGICMAYTCTFNDLAFTDPEKFISQKMRFVVGLKIKPLYLDTSVSGRQVVVENLLEIHLLSCIKLHSMLDSIFFVYNKKPRRSFIKQLIRMCSSKVAQVYQRMCQTHSLTVAQQQHQQEQQIGLEDAKHMFLLVWCRWLSRNGAKYGKPLIKYFSSLLKKSLLAQSASSATFYKDALEDIWARTALHKTKKHAYQKAF